MVSVLASSAVDRGFVLGRVCRITEELRHDNKKDLVSAYSNFTHWYPHIYPQLGRFSTRGVSNVEKPKY